MSCFLPTRFVLFFVLFFSIALCSVSSADVVLLGDSTVADVTSPKFGWGEALPYYLTSEVIQNNASSGASSRSYYNEFWTRQGWPFTAPVEDLVAPGDQVLIQFGHNDIPTGPAGVAVADLDEYKSWLTLLVNEARGLGATPILVTPPSGWAYWQGQHNLTRQGHADAMKDVATSTNTPVIDLHGYSKQQFAMRSESLAIADFEPHDPVTGLPIDDKVHTSLRGAEIWASFVASEFPGAVSATAVPEPSAATLLGFVGVFAWARRWAGRSFEAKIRAEVAHAQCHLLYN